jgi:pteridine reductase
LTDQTTEARVALITGGAARIGAEIGRYLHAAGLDIAIHYRNSAAPAAALAESLNARRPNSAFVVQGDLLDTETPRRLISAVERERGRLDVLVNNASTFYPTPLGGINETQWNDLMGSNVKAPLLLSQAATPLLRSARGAIVNLVDIHALRPKKEYVVYSMAKAANAMMVKSLARELGPEIRVNGVAPGIIFWPEHELGEADKAEMLGRTVLQRPGKAADIARTVRFLALEADYITGQIIPVDGGRTVQQ